MDAHDPLHVRSAVHHAFGRDDLDPSGWTQQPLTHEVVNMTTHALDRVAGTFTDGSAWSLVAKTLHPASESPVFQFIPADHQASTLIALNWLDEPTVYRCGLADALPGALRMPGVHGIHEAEHRITIWLEDAPDTSEWDGDRYHRTAAALGRLSGAWSASEAQHRFRLRHREISELFFGKVRHFDLPTQDGDAFWAQPHVADVVSPAHRHRLRALAERMPAMLGRVDALPRGVCHGDASPANFLEAADGGIVAIDWAFGNVDSIGSDLAQLLAGRCDQGELAAADIEPTATMIVDGFMEGLAIEHCAVDLSDVRASFATHLAARSVFSALIVDAVPEGRDGRRLMESRAALAQFGLELADRHG